MDYTNPHSCRHCEKVVISRPEDHPDLHEGSEPRQSLLLLKVLRALRDREPLLKTLEGAFFLETNTEEIAQFVSDGCLFYQFISSGLEVIEKQRRVTERDKTRERGRLQISDGAGQRSDARLIIVEIKNNAVEISTTYTDQSGNQYVQRTPELLNRCVFGIFPEEGSPAAEKFEAVAPIDVSSDRSFARARNWLQNCVQNHPECAHVPSEFAPTRLIKIWNRQGRRLLQLRESDGTRVPYAALSYCWGGEQDVRTTKSTFSRHRTRINFSDLPRTIQDAVILTEKLGLEYLWVDALCIVQDDEEDRAREIDLMGHVYEKAELTIVASRAQAVQEGFLQNLLSYGYSKPEWVFKMQYRHLSGQISSIVIAPKVFRTPTEYLSERGWAFQERLFSYRVLEYSSTCVHWFCQSHRDCDRQGGKCSASELERGVEIFRGLPDHNSAVTMKTWYKLVDKFSQKSLTLPEDRLPAIGGIAERFGLLSEVEYLAGIWRNSLPSGLLWIVDRYAGPNFVSKSYPPRSSKYLAPSWSWASTTRPIKNGVYVGHGVPKAEVVRVDIGHKTAGTTYGNVTYGHITLRGFITPVTWALPNETDRYSDGKITRSGYSRLSIAICRDATETGLEGGNTIRAYLFVLVSNDETTKVTGLILYKHPDNRYSRLGVFDVPYCPADQETYPTMARSLLQGDQEEVTIV